MTHMQQYHLKLILKANQKRSRQFAQMIREQMTLLMNELQYVVLEQPKE